MARLPTSPPREQGSWALWSPGLCGCLTNDPEPSSWNYIGTEPGRWVASCGRLSPRGWTGSGRGCTEHIQAVVLWSLVTGPLHRTPGTWPLPSPEQKRRKLNSNPSLELHA